MNNNTGIRDDTAATIEHGRMTRAEAIRHLLDLGRDVETSDNPHYPNRAEEALQRLGISPGSIQKAKDLP